jgi:hypothetical protein
MVIGNQHLDAETVRLIDERENVRDGRDLFPLEEGRSSPLAVGRDAVQLVFLRHGEERGAVPLELTREGVTTVRW